MGKSATGYLALYFLATRTYALGVSTSTDAPKAETVRETSVVSVDIGASSILCFRKEGH